MIHSHIRNLVMVLVVPMLMTSCKSRRSQNSNAAAAEAEASAPLSNVQIKDLIGKASQDWNIPETRMAWLTLGANYLHHLENARTALDSLTGKPKKTSLSLANEGPKNSGALGLTPEQELEQSKLQLASAESSARAALEQQKLMNESAKASDDFTMRNKEFYGKMDLQEFDQAIKAATTAVEIEGKEIENFKKRIEAEKMIIENGILRDYAKAYNSYVKVFHEYTLAVGAAMRGAAKASKIAGVLANSVLEYVKGVEKCGVTMSRYLLRTQLDAGKSVDLADYSIAEFNVEKDIRNRVNAVQVLPSGMECLELGFIQANLDDYSIDSDASAYAQKNPILWLNVNRNPSKDSSAVRTIAACPAGNPAKDPLKIVPYLAQVENFAKLAENAAQSLNVQERPVNEQNQNPVTPAEAGAPDIGMISDAGEKLYLTAASYIKDKRADGKSLMLPFPVTPYQALIAVKTGDLEYRRPADSAPSVPYCELRPENDQAGARRLERYIQAIRNFEASRMATLQRSLGGLGVNFDTKKSRMEEFRPGNWTNNTLGLANLVLRRGFYYAEECTKTTIATLQNAAPAPGNPAVTLPASTEFAVGAAKYNFFYPPYSIGDDATTQENKLTQVTRQCMDNELMTLARSQQALTAASEYSAFFSKAADIKAPAAPVPYIPNPAAGTTVYSR